MPYKFADTDFMADSAILTLTILFKYSEIDRKLDKNLIKPNLNASNCSIKSTLQLLPAARGDFFLFICLYTYSQRR